MRFSIDTHCSKYMFASVNCSQTALSSQEYKVNKQTLTALKILQLAYSAALRTRTAILSCTLVVVTAVTFILRLAWSIN
jgi:hypothetical protein